ncbi:hypothetical protein D3C78_1797500 [compost metagenome]
MISNKELSFEGSMIGERGSIVLITVGSFLFILSIHFLRLGASSFSRHGILEMSPDGVPSVVVFSTYWVPITTDDSESLTC